MNPSHPKQLSPRVRVDLQWTSQADQLRWIARDPLTANFFCFSEIERRATQLMTGRLTLLDILDELRRAFPTAGVDQAWLGSLLARLQLHHLFVPSSRAEAARIAAGRGGLRRQGWWQPLLSPLAIRVPLFNPMRLLNLLRPLALILFHPIMVTLWLVVGGCLGILVLRELFLGGVAHSLDMSAMRGDRWLLLFVCYLCAKSLHELGHGLASVRYRAECQEIGVMLLCLAPCLYCDTTDSWKLASKWQRAGIAAAGMYIEWILATLAAAVWLLTQAGTPHSVAASLMVVCSVGTLLINSNPLLKYDGYYILSDVWGVPNLAEQGRDALRALGHWALAGRPLTKSHFDAPLGWLAAYAVVAAVYRLVILAAIVWICWSVLVPLGLGLLAVLLTAMLLCGVVLAQYRGLRLFGREVLAAGGVHMIRWTIFFTLLGLGVAAGFAFPLPTVLRARGVTDFEDKEPLFARQTAELLAVAPINQRISPGALVLEFHSPESQLEVSELRGQIAVLEEELKQLHLRSALDPTTAYQIPAKAEELNELRGRERVLAREIAGLHHTAKYEGYLLAEPQHLAPAITAPRDDRFGLDLLDPRRLGATCDRSTLVGWFSPKEHLAVSVIVPERDVKRLKVGMRGAIQWDANLREVGSGIISRIAPEPIQRTPSELIGDPTLLSARNEQGEFLPDQPHYEVTVQVQRCTPHVRGAPATVQFDMPAQTLWQRTRELIRQNLKPL